MVNKGETDSLIENNKRNQNKFKEFNSRIF